MGETVPYTLNVTHLYSLGTRVEVDFKIVLQYLKYLQLQQFKLPPYNKKQSKRNYVN